MARFLCSTFGSSGDVFPMLGLALALRGRGHEVAFATNPYYEGLARRYGVPFEPLGTLEDFSACIHNPELWHPLRSFRHIFRVLQPSLKRQYEFHAQGASSGTTIGITNALGFGALVAQDRLHVPVVTLHCQPAMIWSDSDPPLLPGMFGPRWAKCLLHRIAERFFVDPVVFPFVNPWREELGLPPMRRLLQWWNSPYAVLCLFPDWFAAPQKDWPGNLIQTSFPLWNDQADEELPAEVQSFLQQGEPPLVFTPGSTNIHGRRFFEAAVGACRLLNRRGILLTEFPEQLPARLPDAVAHFRYVPFTRLLSRAAALVHHGGIGSTSQAMAAGIPQVLMPLAHDQFDNAQRVARLGIGTGIPVHRFTAARLAGNLKTLLSSDATTAACKTLARRLETHDALEHAAVAIEKRVERGLCPTSL